MQKQILYSLACIVAASVLPTNLHAADKAAPSIAYYGVLEDGLAEAKRSGRPIFFVSAAPQCLGVSGIW